jgi:DNA topoisomerase VI subunit A
MYYCLIDNFQNQTALNDTVQEISCLFKCPRSSLGIFSTSKGYLAGSLKWDVIV